jgi:formylglycine-generating enzyme required for sulfatase activity
MNDTHSRTRIAALALLIAASLVGSVVQSSALTAPRSSGVEVYLPFVARQAGPVSVSTPTPTTTPTATLTSAPWLGGDLVSVPAGNGGAAFHIGRTEVTNAQYAQCVAVRVCTVPDTLEQRCRYSDPAYADHPVVCVTREQARAYARWAGGTLPTEEQWTRACRGADWRRYPWGIQPPDATRANYRPAGPGDTTAVGSYPAGASPYGALDMAGNVEEWVDDGDHVVRGGEFSDEDDSVKCIKRREHGYIGDQHDVGFRVARQTGPVPTATLTPAPGSGGELVSVPAGYSAGNSVAAFRIGRTEVTNAQYAQCVAAGICTVPETNSYRCNYSRAEYAGHPVVCVTRDQARAYAAWVGGSLPMEEQWARACQGDDGRQYPWGNQLPDPMRGNFNDYVEHTTPVGSYPLGTSPYGVLDMGGNVGEWVEPNDGDAGRNVIVRGGSFTTSGDSSMSCGVRVEAWTSSYWSPNVGFRVVRQAGPAPTATPAPWLGGDLVSVPAGNGVAAFRIGRTEVTNEQYAQCVAAGACTVPDPRGQYNDPAYANHPVTMVTRVQARAYARWAGGLLPTNAQWTRACQGDDGRRYPWGNQPPDAMRANYWPAGPRDTTAVGSYPAGASPYGALDMAGNVIELVDRGNIASRGGAFSSSEGDIVCSAQSSTWDDDEFNHAVGFRVVSPGP